ncbi:hypothetical protein BDBG_16344 [Blastomyces gilchristii SLH14081]|uniref:Uncharacterized protein n=1 Tax=Blastomyces gilchristii (strain SLH14081) TaxID=559298 RepID=A0A179UAN2_BLAGS|nr:uncharacterized protein BDBG_16344 [Blastomyces gilchristii SLH14081]OAT04773.1 hypothetical protein BDBG_16344 [Blastomyces gilchristii SLH14081]
MKREREKKSITINKQQQKKIKRVLKYKIKKLKLQKLIEKKEIEVLFRSQMHFIIQNIEKTALLSEYINLLITEMKPETADQKMQDFEVQIDLTKKKQ